jgi:hypothetical protein
MSEQLNNETEIERFAREEMGIELLPVQLDILRAAAEGKVIMAARQMGKTTADRVARAYLAKALKPRYLRQSNTTEGK